jgi:NADPH:quinone reductase-like Zn-dependent oxidoreductase
MKHLWAEQSSKQVSPSSPSCHCLHLTSPHHNTPHLALLSHHTHQPQPTGETVLVTASAGGVGIAAVQLAKALGATVIAAAGSPTKLAVSKTYGGADHVVDYTKPGWQKTVLELTGGKGVDVIYDPVGMIKGDDDS